MLAIKLRLSSVLLLLCCSALSSAVTLDYALVTSGSLSSSGSARLPIKWGAVLASSDITLLGFDPLDTANKVLIADYHARGAGLPDPDLPGREKWLRYHTSATLRTRHPDTTLFPSAGIAGVPVVDFFSQLVNGEFPGWTSQNVSLAGEYIPLTVPLAQGILYDNPAATGTSAFVQNWAPAGAKVQQALADFSYSDWKEKAIARYGYVRPKAGGGFTDVFGSTLYVNSARELTTWTMQTTPFTALGQLSMKQYIPASGLTCGVPDRVLFVDTLDGTENGPKASITLTNGDFFWKGVMYVNADFSISSGGGFATVLAKNPDEFAADPLGTSMGSSLPYCFLDGVLVARGTLQKTGRGTIFGALVSDRDRDYYMLPDICYNARLQLGVLPSAYTQRVETVQSGPWNSGSTWSTMQVPPAGSAVHINVGHSVFLFHAVLDMTSIVNDGTLNLFDKDLYLRGGELVNHGTLESAGPGHLLFGNGGTLENTGSISLGMQRLMVFGIGTSTTLSLYSPGPAIVAGNVSIYDMHLAGSPLQCSGAALTVMKSLQIDDGYPVAGTPEFDSAAELIYSQGVHEVGPEWRPGQDSRWPRTIVVRGDYTDVHITNASPVPHHAYAVRIESETARLLAWNTDLHISQELLNYGTLEQRATVGYTEIPHTLSNYGVIRCTGSYGLEHYGATGVRMNAVNPGTSSHFVVERRDSDPIGVLPSMQDGRYWVISTDGTDYEVNLTLPHNGATDPYVCRYTGVGYSWTPGRTSYTASDVTLEGVTELSTWAVGDAALGSVPVSVSGFSVE